MFLSGRRTMQLEVLKWMILALLALMLALGFAAHTAGSPPVESPKAVAIVSPWSGFFRASEYPGGPALVEIGSQVEPGTIVGVIDTMMAQPPMGFFRISAGVKGTIVKVFVVDGQPVSIGQPLFEVLPAAN